ncbi:hypothetical protein [Saccharopolyspora gregorii]|uniref:Uncharacterized protein n=1 Tax=Saccharopolyspora gregorii TaxID=33914 RepID=A0ABP6RLD0_9PSEU
MLQVVVVAVVVLSGVALGYVEAERRTEEAPRTRSRAVANTLAVTPGVLAAVTGGDPPRTLQPWAERVRTATASGSSRYGSVGDALHAPNRS